MNRTQRYIALGAALGCAVAPRSSFADESAPVITNYKFGLICGASDNRRVCFQTDVIQITNESRCVYNQSVRACTWYGYSFDYESPTDLTINCLNSWDKPIAAGNPYKKDPAATGNFKYDLELKQGSHHFFLANYIAGERSPNSPAGATYQCSYQGNQLFSTDAHFEFPESMLPIQSVPDANGLPPEAKSNQTK